MKSTRRRPAGPSVSLEELAEQQGVKPVANLQDVAGLWPVEDDAGALLRFILAERRARRRLRRPRK